MVAAMRTPEQLTDRYRAEGRKITPQRLAIFEALHGNHSHPTADVVWDQVRSRKPSISLRTVYQVLNDLVELGEIEAVDVGHGPARFDPNTEQHDHFVCERCARVIDVRSDGPVLLEQPAGQPFVVDTVTITFRGTCPECVRGDQSVTDDAPVPALHQHINTSTHRR